MPIDFRKIARQTLAAQHEPCTVTQGGAPFPTHAVPTTTEGLFEDGTQFHIATVTLPEESLQEPVDSGHRFEFKHITYVANGPVDPDQDGILNIKVHEEHS